MLFEMPRVVPFGLMDLPTLLVSHQWYRLASWPFAFFGVFHFLPVVAAFYFEWSALEAVVGIPVAAVTWVAAYALNGILAAWLVPRGILVLGPGSFVLSGAICLLILKGSSPRGSAGRGLTTSRILAPILLLAFPYDFEPYRTLFAHPAFLVPAALCGIVLYLGLRLTTKPRPATA